MKGVSVGKKKRRQKPKTKPAKFKKQKRKESNPKTITEKKPNPFDLASTKRFGSNSKAQKGKTVKQSNELLGKSKIFDRRIGQRNFQLSDENKVEKRFLFQQKKLAEKKDAEFEVKNDDSQNKPEMEGFGLKRIHWRNLGNFEGSDDEGSEDEYFGKQSKRSRKESLAQIVANDRQMRALKSMLKDEIEETTERLDVSFKEIKQLGGLVQSRPSDEKSEEPSFEDAYDSLYNDLQFNPTPVARPQTVTTVNEDEQSTKKENKSLSDIEQTKKEENAKKEAQSKMAKEREKKWAKRVKNERRSTIKQLRREAKNSAKLFIEKRREIRKERDEKTKKILQSLEIQESEYKKLRAIGGKV